MDNGTATDHYLTMSTEPPGRPPFTPLTQGQLRGKLCDLWLVWCQRWTYRFSFWFFCLFVFVCLFLFVLFLFFYGGHSYFEKPSLEKSHKRHLCLPRENFPSCIFCFIDINKQFRGFAFFFFSLFFFCLIGWSVCVCGCLCVCACVRACVLFFFSCCLFVCLGFLLLLFSICFRLFDLNIVVTTVIRVSIQSRCHNNTMLFGVLIFDASQT